MSRATLFASTVSLAAALAGAPAVAAPVTYSEHVAPIFFEHCASCHRPDQVAPMSLLTYAEARPWAKSIARAVESHKMPPWSPESERLHFQHDLSLAPEQIETILGWVRDGAPEGDPALLPPTPSFDDGWTLGEPDYVITLSPVQVPAAGDDLFPQEWIDLDLDGPRWVRAIEFMPGDRRVTHHFQTTYNTPANAAKPLGDATRTTGTAASSTGIFAIWTAGMPPYVFPEGMGRVISPETRILVDSHYHPFGEATTDQTRIGVYFGEGELRKEVATLVAVNTGLRIPPGAPAHPELATYLFDRDMQILAFSPHLHVRGKAMRYDLVYPDGRRETLLDVPRYDYNWQWLYYPTEPVDVPSGSLMEVTAVWDNSAQNRANPDPTAEIIYRGDTFNEMFVGFFEAIPKEGVYHQAKPVQDKLADILAAHPAESTWRAAGFMPMGLYVPREGEGWLYLVQGIGMFSISLDDFAWDGSRLHITTQFPTPEASATTTTIDAELAADGSLKGTLSLGADQDKPFTVPFVAQPSATDRPAPTSSVGD